MGYPSGGSWLPSTELHVIAQPKGSYHSGRSLPRKTSRQLGRWTCETHAIAAWQQDWRDISPGRGDRR